MKKDKFLQLRLRSPENFKIKIVSRSNFSDNTVQLLYLLLLFAVGVAVCIIGTLNNADGDGDATPTAKNNSKYNNCTCTVLWRAVLDKNT